jgi:hypothetical protein
LEIFRETLLPADPLTGKSNEKSRESFLPQCAGFFPDGPTSNVTSNFIKFCDGSETVTFPVFNWYITAEFPFDEILRDASETDEPGMRTEPPGESQNTTIAVW